MDRELERAKAGEGEVSSATAERRVAHFPVFAHACVHSHAYAPKTRELTNAHTRRIVSMTPLMHTKKREYLERWNVFP